MILKIEFDLLVQSQSITVPQTFLIKEDKKLVIVLIFLFIKIFNFLLYKIKIKNKVDFFIKKCI